MDAIAKRRLTVLLGIADRATDAKAQSKLDFDDPGRTMDLGELTTHLSSCDLAFTPAVCGMLAWIGLAGGTGGDVRTSRGWAGLAEALAAVPDIDDPFMWSYLHKDAFENAGFDFDKREWGEPKTAAQIEERNPMSAKPATWGEGWSRADRACWCMTSRS